MANSSVHFSPEIIERLNRVAQRMRMSRNRVIVRACERYLDEVEAEGGWPAAFFEPLPDGERDELEAARNEMDVAINLSRSSRSRPPF